MIHMSKKWFLAGILVLLMLLCTAAMADTATVTADSLYLREGPDSSTAVVKLLREGDVLTITGKSGSWYQVTTGNYTGYVYKDYIAVTKTGDETLQKGDSGAAVKSVQQRLKELGYYSASCDGNYGNQTVNAVKAFQKKNGLSQTGIADAATQKKLNATTAVKANASTTEVSGTLQKGHRGALVKQLQERLKELGYYHSAVDSSYGAQTVNAVKAFQKKNGLSQTGIADTATQKKLYASSAVKANATASKDDETLKKGDKGTAVKQLQQRLKELGYYTTTIDSDYGAQTVNAVKAFQKKNGLSQTGVADEATIKKLNSTSAIKANGKTETVTLKKGAKGSAVKQLQERLKELGYYTSVIDSDYGTQTVNAVKAFQKKNGLSQTGNVDAATMNKLNSTSAIKANTDTNTKYATLKKGDKGAEVKLLQERLKELGYYTTVIDSDYGTKTINAVKAFQQKNGLTADGVAGEATLKKIYSASAVKNGTTTTNTNGLKSGDKGAEVKKLQERLKELGYYTSVIDSEYGSKTIAAVKAFQKKNGLTADGLAGEATLKKVYASSAVKNGTTTTTTTTTLKSGAKGEAVKELQRRLKELSYYNNSIDGDYGAKTVVAVKAFQKKNGLTADGVAGSSTLKKLNSTSAVKANTTTNNNTTTTDGLKSGDKGTEVKKLQERLKELGYYTSAIDSQYGAKTIAAVKAFQQKNGLTVDGVASSATLKKINASNAVAANGKNTVTLNTNQTLKSGDSGAQVKALQARLKELGYYTTTLDSDYGYRTTAAVSDFQRANKLTVTGTANPATLRKLVSSSAVSASQANKDNNANTGNTTTKYKTEKLDWFNGGRAKFAGRPVIEIKDVKTGLVFKGKVLYGEHHLDVEPLTKADTATLLKINGGVEFKWYRRPMLVKHNGHVYAASIYSVPHGEQTILNNNFEGQFCLHFYGSKTHGTDEVKQDHQDAIAQAMKATW